MKRDVPIVWFYKGHRLKYAGRSGQRKFIYVCIDERCPFRIYTQRRLTNRHN